MGDPAALLRPYLRAPQLQGGKGTYGMPIAPARETWGWKYVLPPSAGDNLDSIQQKAQAHPISGSRVRDQVQEVPIPSRQLGDQGGLADDRFARQRNPDRPRASADDWGGREDGRDQTRYHRAETFDLSNEFGTGRNKIVAMVLIDGRPAEDSLRHTAGARVRR